MAKEISGRGRRRSRNEKGNQGVGYFRFINVVQIFSIYCCFFIVVIFCSIPFLPTTFTQTHTHDPRPLPTTHDPRHLATLVKNIAAGAARMPATEIEAYEDDTRLHFDMESAFPRFLDSVLQ